MMAMVLPDKLEETFMVGLFLMSTLPAIHKLPVSVIVGVPLISKSQLIFFGPIVILEFILYGQGEFITPPCSASVSQPLTVSSEIGRPITGWSWLFG